MDIATPAARARGSIVPWLFPAGLGLVVAVNMVMLWFALTTFPGVATRHAYAEGRAYNRVIARDAGIAELGWRTTVRVVDSGGAVEAVYVGRDGAPVAALTPRAVFTRPVGERASLEVALSETEPGVYRAAVALPLRGVWAVRLTAGAHEAVARVMAP